jgi:hypothetical protein
MYWPGEACFEHRFQDRLSAVHKLHGQVLSITIKFDGGKVLLSLPKDPGEPCQRAFFNASNARGNSVRAEPFGYAQARLVEVRTELSEFPKASARMPRTSPFQVNLFGLGWQDRTS